MGGNIRSQGAQSPSSPGVRMTLINRRFFFTQVRRKMFSNDLRQSQVDGLNAILDDGRRNTPPMTTLARLRPSDDLSRNRSAHAADEEYGKGRGIPYGKPDPTTGQVYYGRELVQLTWECNYKTLTDLLGVDFVNHPDLALELDNATNIMFIGMIKGLFTSKSLSDYFNQTTEDWVNAPKIINGLDKAQAIAMYGHNFYSALSYTTLISLFARNSTNRETSASPKIVWACEPPRNQPRARDRACVRRAALRRGR